MQWESRGIVSRHSDTTQRWAGEVFTLPGLIKPSLSANYHHILTPSHFLQSICCTDTGESSDDILVSFSMICVLRANSALVEEFGR